MGAKKGEAKTLVRKEEKNESKIQWFLPVASAD